MNGKRGGSETSDYRFPLPVHQKNILQFNGGCFSGAPGRNRTHNRWLRTPLLYPIELPGQGESFAKSPEAPRQWSEGGTSGIITGINVSDNP